MLLVTIQLLRLQSTLAILKTYLDFFLKVARFAFSLHSMIYLPRVEMD